MRLGLFGYEDRAAAREDGGDRPPDLFVGSMNFDPRSKIHNTEIGLFIVSPEMAQQVLKLIDALKQQGAYRLRLGADGRRLEWSAATATAKGPARGARLRVLGSAAAASCWHR